MQGSDVWSGAGRADTRVVHQILVIVFNELGYNGQVSARLV